jgi:hypothetical protein
MLLTSNAIHIVRVQLETCQACKGNDDREVAGKGALAAECSSTIITAVYWPLCTSFFESCRRCKSNAKQGYKGNDSLEHDDVVDVSRRKSREGDLMLLYTNMVVIASELKEKNSQT